jgi:2-polyprenyl-3-methyl-5-hydroxy-6-metoxy-1,4-benzoquinol methylase
MDARFSWVSEVLDLVGAFDVLEHIEDDNRVLRELYRMLAPNGVVIATVPQHRWLWSSVDEQCITTVATRLESWPKKRALQVSTFNIKRVSAHSLCR